MKTEGEDADHSLYDRVGDQGTRQLLRDPGAERGTDRHAPHKHDEHQRLRIGGMP